MRRTILAACAAACVASGAFAADYAGYTAAVKDGADPGAVVFTVKDAQGTALGDSGPRDVRDVSDDAGRDALVREVIAAVAAARAEADYRAAEFTAGKSIPFVGAPAESPPAARVAKEMLPGLVDKYIDYIATHVRGSHSRENMELVLAMQAGAQAPTKEEFGGLIDWFRRLREMEIGSTFPDEKAFFAAEWDRLCAEGFIKAAYGCVR